LLFLFL